MTREPRRSGTRPVGGNPAPQGSDVRAVNKTVGAHADACHTWYSTEPSTSGPQRVGCRDSVRHVASFVLVDNAAEPVSATDARQGFK